MKKLFFSLILLLTFGACSDETNEPKDIVLDRNTASEQTIFADQTSTNEGISFHANQNWVARVQALPTTKATEQVDWITLSQYEGGAGDFTIKLTIRKNDTGASRSAVIEIVCGATSIRILVEQKHTTESGEELQPEEPQSAPKIVRIKSKSSEENYEFKYDSKGRIIEYHFIDVDQEGTETINARYTYTTKADGGLQIDATYKRVYGDEAKTGREQIVTDQSGKAIRSLWEGDGESSYRYNAANQLIHTLEAGNNTDLTWENKNMIRQNTVYDNSGNSEYTEITYGSLLNNANLDLAHLLFRNEACEGLAFWHGCLGTLQVMDCFGERVANMPHSMKYNSAFDSPDSKSESVVTFEYQLDAEQKIVQIRSTSIHTIENEFGKDTSTTQETYDIFYE